MYFTLLILLTKGLVLNYLQHIKVKNLLCSSLRCWALGQQWCLLEDSECALDSSFPSIPQSFFPKSTCLGPAQCWGYHGKWSTVLVPKELMLQGMVKGNKQLSPRARGTVKADEKIRGFLKRAREGQCSAMQRCGDVGRVRDQWSHRLTRNSEKTEGLTAAKRLRTQGQRRRKLEGRPLKAEWPSGSQPTKCWDY